MSADILIVDDEQDIRKLTANDLSDEGYKTATAATAEDAIRLFKEEKPHLVLLDIWLEGSSMDGVGVLKQLKKYDPSVPVIMMSGHGNIETAVNSLKNGAYDFIEKPFKFDRLILVVRRALDIYKLKHENEELWQKMLGEDELVGTSAAIQNLRQMVDKVGPTRSRVLLTGASGSGKELVAKQIHLKSDRKDAPFIIVNCAALAGEHGEQELFGEETGGDITHIGLLEKAEGGTLLLDEINEMPSAMQSKMIRLMQEDSFERTRGARKIHSDIRFMASSTKDLAEEMKKGNLREDLYYRLNVVPIRMPSLKERREDIPVLIEYFLTKMSEAKSLTPPKVSPEVLTLLTSYDWSGNVRQLKNVIEWLIIISPDEGAEITKEMLPAEINFSSPDSLRWNMAESVMPLPLKEAREVFEKEYLTSQLKRFGDNITQTARFVGMERSALYRKLKSLGVDTKE